MKKKWLEWAKKGIEPYKSLRDKLKLE